MFNFTYTNIPVHLSVSIFALAAVVIWFVAARITGIANAIISGNRGGATIHRPTARRHHLFARLKHLGDRALRTGRPMLPALNENNGSTISSRAAK